MVGVKLSQVGCAANKPEAMENATELTEQSFITFSYCTIAYMADLP
jgi:hypothetical protein